MKSNSVLSGFCRQGQLLSTITLAIMFIASSLLAQSDNFDDGNDNSWVRVDVLAAYGGPNTYSFPSGPFGKGYRIQCTTSAALAGACGSCGTGRSVAYRTNYYTDFYIAVDLVNWDNTLDQAMVLVGRATGLTNQLDPCPLPGPCPPGFGTLNGYICNYDCNQSGAGATDARGGQFQINRVDVESPTTLASADISLIPGKAYRMILTGVGSLLTAQLYDLEDLSAPLVTIQTTDSNYTGPGQSGLIAFSRDATTADMTFDNYYAAATDPNSDIAPAIRHSVPQTPQVVTRVPANRFANLYPASGNVSFNVQTFSTNQINAAATRLYLNGTDASSSLVPSPGFGTNITFSATAGLLSANTVYTARVEVQDTTGTLKSTNTFWLDTFSNAYLTNSPDKTIEAEDYNYSNGVYQLEPITLSGVDTNGFQLNGNGVGYYNLDGTPEVDYHTSRTSTEGGWNDYRPDDFIGTLQGNREDIQDLNHQPPTTPPVDDPSRPNDNQRPTYLAVNLKEYEVARTLPGEWLNYTRIFADTNYYVYLRCGGAGAQDVSLDLVNGDPTTTNQTTTALGTFQVQNHLMRLNYLYEPLTQGGAPAIVHLAGTNTLRLTINGTPSKDNRLLYLNYLLFVPTANVTARPRLTVAPTAGGLTLSWPQVAFRLQTSPSLTSPVWTTVTNGITQVGNLNVYSASTSSGSAYYRLISP